MNTKKLISIIIPCYRSEKSLDAVVQEIHDEFVLHDDYDYQLILVNDHSPDDTIGVIRRICGCNHMATGIDLTRNFGQPSAKLSAIPYARGDYVVFMDDDGQHPASGIFSLIELLENGHDVSYAFFNERKHTMTQRMGSALNDFLMTVLLNKPRDIVPSSFMAMTWTIAENLSHYKSPTPHIWGFILKTTQNIAGTLIEHRERTYGTSGYKLSKQISLWLNGLTGFSVKPLRIASLLGMGSAVCGFAYGIALIVRKLLNPSLQTGYASIMTTLLFVGGIIMILLGLLGEYIGRIMISLNNIPQSAIREIIYPQFSEKQDTLSACITDDDMCKNK